MGLRGLPKISGIVSLSEAVPKFPASVGGGICQKVVFFVLHVAGVFFVPRARRGRVGGMAVAAGGSDSRLVVLHRPTFVFSRNVLFGDILSRNDDQDESSPALRVFHGGLVGWGLRGIAQISGTVSLSETVPKFSAAPRAVTPGTHAPGIYLRALPIEMACCTLLQHSSFQGQGPFGDVIETRITARRCFFREMFLLIYVLPRNNHQDASSPALRVFQVWASGLGLREIAQISGIVSLSETVPKFPASVGARSGRIQLFRIRRPRPLPTLDSQSPTGGFSYLPSNKGPRPPVPPIPPAMACPKKGVC